MKFFDDEDDTGEKMLINTLQPAMLAAVVFCMMLFVQPGWLPGIESWLHLCIGGFLTGMVFSFIAFFTVARRVKAGGMQASLAGGLVHRFVKCHWDYVRWAITGIILAIAMMAAVLKSKIIGDVLLDTVLIAAQVRAHLQVFQHRQVGKHAASLGRLGDARLQHLVDGLAQQLLIVIGDGAAVGLHQAGDGAQGGGLTGAVGADQGDDLAVRHLKADTPQGLDAAVGHM